MQETETAQKRVFDPLLIGGRKSQGHFPEDSGNAGLDKIRTNAGTFIDWLSFTIPQTTESWKYLDVILGEWDRGESFRTYRDSRRYRNGAIAAFNSTGRIYVVLSASALFCLEWDPGNLVSGCLQHGAKFTRIDIARDDLAGMLSLDSIVASLREWNVQTRWKTWSRIESHSRTGAGGQTVYVGDRASMGFLRVYDKAAQTQTDGHWIRCELELKGDKAVSMSKLIARQDLDYSAVLYDHIRFLEQCTGPKRRWPDSPWWTDFLDTCTREKLELPKYEVGLQEVKEWFDNTCTSALYLLTATAEKTGTDLTKILASGRKRFEENPRHQKVKAMADAGQMRSSDKKEVLKWRYGAPKSL